MKKTIIPSILILLFAVYVFGGVVKDASDGRDWWFPSGSLGIGTANPGATLEIQRALTDTYVLEVSSNNGVSMFSIDGHGHLQTTGDAPALSSCGTSPSITGNDNAAHITVGTSESGTCTVTFAHPFENKPVCNCDDDTAVQNCKTVETTTTLTVSGTWSDNEEIDYTCIGIR